MKNKFEEKKKNGLIKNNEKIMLEVKSGNSHR